MLKLTSTEAQWLTLAFMLVVTAVVIGYDIIAIKTWGVGTSISRVLRWLFRECPSLMVALVFWLGVLVGHCFLPVE